MFATHLNSLSEPDARPRNAAGGVVVLALILLAVLADVAMAAAPVKLSSARAERAARVAVAPLPVEAARCVSIESTRGRQRKLCVLRHPDVADQVCTSWVIVSAPARTKVQTRHICFPDLVFDGISPRGVRLSAATAEGLAHAAVAPLVVKGKRCIPLPGTDGRERRLCLLEHPAEPGTQCTSFVLVTAPVEVEVQTRNLCFPEFRPPWS